jgi:hypothetical protein
MCQSKIETNTRRKRRPHKTNPKNQGLNLRVKPQAHIECSVVDPHPPHASGFSPVHSGHRTISNFLDQGCRDDVDAKNFRFLYACGVPFNVLRSPYWHEMVQAINGAPKGYKSPGYDKARTMGLDRERAKIHSALGQFTNDWNQYGVSIVSDGWTNVKGRPLINILGVSASGVVFLSAHDYSDHYKTRY